MKLENEIAIMMKEFAKAQAVLKDKKVSQQKKALMDLDKWRKKFKFVFDREKIIGFDATEGSYIFSKKGIITLFEPKALKPMGATLLQNSASFWVLFAFYVKGKIDSDIEIKEKVRRQIVDTFFECGTKVPQQTQLKMWLDTVLYLPDINDKPATEQKSDEVSEKQYEKPVQSAIRSNLNEIQQEEEIIFFDDIPIFSPKQPKEAALMENDITFNGNAEQEANPVQPCLAE